MANLNSFTLAEFEGKGGASRNALEVVPTIWIDKATNRCFWPRKNISILIKDCRSEPDDSWKSYNVTRIFGTYGN